MKSVLRARARDLIIVKVRFFHHHFGDHCLVHGLVLKYTRPGTRQSCTKCFSVNVMDCYTTVFDGFEDSTTISRLIDYDQRSATSGYSTKSYCKMKWSRI